MVYQEVQLHEEQAEIKQKCSRASIRLMIEPEVGLESLGSRRNNLAIRPSYLFCLSGQRFICTHLESQNSPGGKGFES